MLPDDLDALAHGRVRPAVEEVVALLERRGEALAELYSAADQVRRDVVGDEIYLRGIVEFSNICRLNCSYCGIRRGNRRVERYRMSPAEILDLAVQAKSFGYSTVVLQSGEDPWFTRDVLCELLQRIKAAAGVAVTLSVGERSPEDLHAFRLAGADRYLLRFETSDRALFARIHPDDDFDRRRACLAHIRDADLQLGSGFLIGLPGVGLEVLACDILYATELQLDMIGCGPFIAHPDTPLGGEPLLDDREVYYKTLAILRLLNPYAHIPSTTAFDAVFEGGRDLALQRGANVFMPNVTPQTYRARYLLYPNKPCVDEDGSQCSLCVLGRALGLGRSIGRGPGHSMLPAWRARHQPASPSAG